MILGWMLYALVVGGLLAAAAAGLEGLGRALSVPVRWVWLGAMLALVALTAIAPLRSTPAPAALELPVAAVGGDQLGAAVTREVSASSGPAALLASARQAGAAPIERALAAAGGAAPAAARIAALLWLAGSLGVGLAFLFTARRWARRRRGWERRELAGTAVRIAPRAGPAVVGLVRPEIVVPRWLVSASADEQRLVVLHETEHLRAHDPVTLAAGCLVVALLPWHPAAWWMLLRLRLAVELDCDRRVLGRGVRPLAYGSVLIDVAGRGSGITLGAPALADTPSTLERRISAMTTRISRVGTVRAAALAVPASFLLVVACDTDLPTTAEVEAMDVAAAEAQAQHFRIIRGADGETARYFVNGEEVSAEEARALMGDHIDAIEVLRAGEAGEAQIRIRTREGEVHEERHLRLRGETADGERRVHILRQPAEGEALEAGERRLRVERAGERPGHLATADFDGIIEIDGERVDPSAFRDLDPDRIERVEVIKGEAAARLYDDPAARNGVIRIRTRQ